MNSATKRWISLLAILAGCLSLMSAAGAHEGLPAEADEAAYMEVTGFVDDSSVSFLERQIKAASARDEVAVLIIRVDSPGVLDTSVQPAIAAITASRVPVIVWVAAGEAEAGSAAALLAVASHRALMAPAATIGPLLPLDLREFDETPDLAAQRRQVAAVLRESERDVSPQDLTLLEDEAIPARRALELGIIDGTAPNVQELLLGLKGETVRTGAGQVTFSDEPFRLRFVKMTVLERLVHSAARPELAYLLLLFGLFGLIFELYNPGIGAAGLAGGVSVGFSLYAFTILPTNWMALAAVLAAFMLLGKDLKTQSLGPFSIVGLILLAGGSLRLYSGAHPSLDLPLWAVIAGVLMTLSFYMQVMTSAIRARTAKPLPGADGIVGAVGIARTDISPDGQVMARGTLWRARTLGAAIGQGTAVKVLGTSGMMLMVEPTAEKVPEQDSSV